MRSASAKLIEILASQSFAKANLFVITLVSGLAYYFTDADIDIVFENQMYDSTGPQIAGAKYNLVRGMQVSSLDLTVMAKPTDLLGGVPWSLAVRTGALRNADVTIKKAFMQEWGDAPEVMEIFRGKVNESSEGEIEIVLTVVSDASRLNMQIPRKIYQAGCGRTLYDSGCGVSRSAYSVTATVQNAPNRYTIAVSLAQPDGHFNLGELIFTTGNNAGVRRAVKNYSAGVIVLSYPLHVDIAAGDTFIVRAGCDRTRGPNGCLKFSNLDNFNGTPFIPPPESAI